MKKMNGLGFGRYIGGLTALVLGAGLLASCAPSKPLTDAELDRGHQFRPAYNVEHTIHRHLFPVSAAKSSADERDYRDLYDFLVGIGARTGDTVVVASRRSRVEQRGDVVAFVRRLGLIPDMRLIKEGAVTGEDDGYEQTILVRFDKYTARNPDCGQWGEKINTNFYNTSPRNFGCANTAGLQQQVAYPSSLITGKMLDFPEGDVAAESVSRYRGRKVEQIKTESAASK